MKLMFTNKILVFLTIIIFSHSVFSQAAVLVEPVDKNASLQLYPFEVAEYRLIVVNLSETPVNDFRVVITVPEELSFVIDGRDVNERFFTFERLPPSAREERIFSIKALQPTETQISIKADFGTVTLDNSSLTTLSVVDSGVVFNAELENAALAPGSKGVVFFDVSNNSNERISDIKVDFVSAEEVSVSTKAFEKSFLDVGETIPKTPLDFSLGNSLGKKTLVARFTFTDSKGFHVLEKSFSLEIGQRDLYVAVFVVAILILVVVAIYFGRKKNQKNSGSEGKSSHAENNADAAPKDH
ncbi:MAG TPA: hypothetical protein VFF13_06845 [archaeon]|nr:hypothetical protein [archaeon]